jgi:hypothetical protein
VLLGERARDSVGCTLLLFMPFMVQSLGWQLALGKASGQEKRALREERPQATLRFADICYLSRRSSFM